MPPGQKFAHGLIQKYIQTAPLSFQVHRPAKISDFTQTLGDGVTSLEKEGVKRRILTLNLQNPDLNRVMSELGAKKIGFLKQVEPQYIDRQKLDLLESLRIKTNEHDQRVLEKQPH